MCIVPEAYSGAYMGSTGTVLETSCGYRPRVMLLVWMYQKNVCVCMIRIHKHIIHNVYAICMPLPVHNIHAQYICNCRHFLLWHQIWPSHLLPMKHRELNEHSVGSSYRGPNSMPLKNGFSWRYAEILVYCNRGSPNLRGDGNHKDVWWLNSASGTKRRQTNESKIYTILHIAYYYI